MPTLSGTIIDAAGRPIAGATIRVTATDTGDLASLTDTVTGASLSNPLTTDALGAYAASVGGGSYLLTVQKGSSVATSTLRVGGLGSQFAFQQFMTAMSFAHLAGVNDAFIEEAAP